MVETAQFVREVVIASCPSHRLPPPLHASTPSRMPALTGAGPQAVPTTGAACRMPSAAASAQIDAWTGTRRKKKLTQDRGTAPLHAKEHPAPQSHLSYTNNLDIPVPSTVNPPCLLPSFSTPRPSPGYERSFCQAPLEARAGWWMCCLLTMSTAAGRSSQGQHHRG